MKTPMLRYVLSAFCLLAAQLPGQQSAQAPAAPVYTQSLTYLKVAPNKNNEFLRLIRDESMKVAQVRVDAGEYLIWTLLRSVFPGGAEARADYVISVISEGRPRASGGSSALEANLKKAGITMSADEYWARRDGVVSRVASELWRVRELVAGAKKGHYVYLNFMKVPDAAAYNDFEAKVWRPMAEGWVKDGSMSGWLFATKILPSGSDTVYSAYSADIFPTWDAAFAGDANRMQRMFEKVHPGKSYQELTANMAKLRSLAKRELWTVVERVEKSGR